MKEVCGSLRCVEVNLYDTKHLYCAVLHHITPFQVLTFSVKYSSPYNL